MKLLAYIRVSTDDQSLSMEAQMKDIVEFCRAGGHELVEVFSDEDVSAFKEISKRPGGAKLLKASREHQGIGVLCTRIDRMFRNAVDGMVTAKKWEALNIPIYIKAMGSSVVVTDTATGWLLFQTLLVHAEFERNLTAERTSDVKKMRRDKLLKYSSQAPYGWRFNKDDSEKLEHDPETWPVVQKVFELRRLCFSYGEIIEEVRSTHGVELYKMLIKRILEHELNNTNKTPSGQAA